MPFTRTDLGRAAASQHAVGAFNTYGSWITEGIIVAAEQAQRPVLLQTSPSKPSSPPDVRLMAATVAATAHCSVRVGVHLDHCRDLDHIRIALDCGYSSVMIDASHLPLKENIRAVQQVVQLARSYDAWVEAELGAIAGDEHKSTGAAADGAMTDPSEAAELTRETGVDALAVAVGNVHGFTAPGARLDLERLGLIRDAVSVPLVLHGASGVDRGDLAAAVAAGVVKVNVNTELREAFLSNFDAAAAAASGWSYGAAVEPAKLAVSAVVASKIQALSPKT